MLLIFIVFIWFAGSLNGSEASMLSNSAAAEKAANFIWSQVDSETNRWPEGEISSAILGIVSAKPPTKGGRYANLTQQLIVDLNVETMATDFLQRVFKPTDKQKKVGSLDNIDIPTLIQWIGVLMVNCKNPRYYFGYDLVAEAVKRLDEVSSAAPTHGALIMTICNADSEGILKRQHFQSLVKAVPSIGHKCPFCVERSSFNILALACLVGKSSGSEDNETHLPSVKSLRGLIGRYTKYIDSVQEPDGGFGSIFATSLAIQAKLSTKVKFEFDVDAAWKTIKAAQKPDGSFGSSVTVTAITLPSLTGQTAIDIKRIPCTPAPKDDGPNIIVAYELEDLVFSQQRFRGHISVPKKNTLLKALQDYAKENPTIFQLETETVGIGTRILSINGIKNDEAATTHWFLDALYKDGRVVPISTSIGTTVVESAQKVVYRMTFKTAKLGL